MKRIVAICCIIALCATAMSQKMRFENTVKDLGTIKETAGKVVCEYHFVNKIANAYVDAVKSPYRHLRVEYKRDLMKKNAEGIITLTYDPAGKSGVFSHDVTVTTMEKNKPYTYVLTLKGYVEPRPRTPQEIYPMKEGNVRYVTNSLQVGVLTPTTVHRDTFRFYNESDIKLTFEARQVPGSIKVVYVTPELLPGEGGILVTDFDAKIQNDWGVVFNKVVIYTNDPDRPNKTFYIGGRILDDFSSWTPKQLANAPRLKVSEEEYKFGEVEEGEPVEHDFILTNTGRSTLYLRKLKQSCSCTIVKPEKMELAPGESTIVKAVFRTYGKHDKQMRTIDVICNDPEQPSVTLKITGFVKPKKN